MKKFLTVLLALSVVFTYTVGTAFALPSDGTETAGLPQAKAEAVAELDEFDYSAYTDAGQTIAKGYVAKAKSEVEDATTITAVQNAMKAFNASINGISGYLKDAVAKAQNEAIKQITDYVYLFGLDYDRLQANSATLAGAIVNNGNIDLDSLQLVDDEDAFIKAIQKADMRIDGAASVADVEKQLNSAIEVVDEYMAKLTAVDLPADKKDDLVKEIIAYADSKKISTKPAAAGDKTYSSTIVNKYNKIVDEAIAAAKAATTYKDYYEVINKYLGSYYKSKTTAVKSANWVAGSSNIYPNHANNANGFVDVIPGQGIFILEESAGELNKLANMDVETEAQIAAAQKALNALGDYNYKDIAKDKWDKAEALRLGLAKFVESGNINDLTTDIQSIISGVTSTMAPSAVNAEANSVLSVYAGYTRLAQYKIDAINDINSFIGYEWDWTLAQSGDYAQDTLAQIQNLQDLYGNYINVADSYEKVDSYVDAYNKKVDTYKTIREAQIAKDADDVNAAIDRVVKATIGNKSLTPDQTALINRIVADLKARVKSGENFPWTWDSSLSETAKDAKVTSASRLESVFGMSATAKYDIVDVVNDIIASQPTFTYPGLYGYTIDASGAGNAYAAYDPSDYGQEKNDLEKYAGYLDDAAKKQGQTWAGYLAEYDKYVALCDAVETQASKEYKEAVKAAEAAINALGTVENTKAFEAKLKTATDALDVVTTKFNAMLPAEQVAAAEVSNEATYDDAVYELAHLKYLASLSATPSVLPTVNAFYDIARGITDPSVISYYTKADQNKILEIVTTARDAIDAATTDAAKVELAEKAIADLKAIIPAADDMSDYTVPLAANKDEAVKYFNKYYKAAFASDASTATALIKDILAFNEQFHAPDESLAALKTAVKGTHMKIFSSAKKGYIKISWKKSNSNVALDGVEVYRSTKKTSGFKKISTFKKQTAKKYTKNMKKGTKYYFYVKGYKMVGDEKVYTHNSITVYRTFRK